jgi:hypothetical protein
MHCEMFYSLYKNKKSLVFVTRTISNSSVMKVVSKQINNPFVQMNKAYIFLNSSKVKFD